MSIRQKLSAVYVCAKCDAQSPKWTGQCLECGGWGTLSAEAVRSSGTARKTNAPTPKIIDFSSVRTEKDGRLSTGIRELDRVLGGGFVSGSAVLIGGEPGVGKSTVAMMAAAAVAASTGRALYVSGEESASQVKLRADRIGLGGSRIGFLAENDVDAVIAALESEKPSLAVIDSVQLLNDASVPSEAGGATQVRAVASRLVGAAKSLGIPLLLIGHVTKDGMIAGPKTLEHIVDAVLSFEGERGERLRVLRALKNRFGSTEETGIFAMEESGLVEVTNPSAELLEARHAGVSGSAVCCLMEGTRPILVEIQALVRRTSFGYPARRASGIESSRLEMLIAVLSKRGGLDLGSHDVYVNVVGGLKAREPAADLAVIMALASSAKDAPLDAATVAWGEVGLGGEVRPSPSHERRLHESASLGMGTAIVALPKSGKTKIPANISVQKISTVAEATAVFQKRKTPAT